MSAVSLLGSLNEDSSLSMDKSDVTPIAKYLKSLGAQPTDLLRFFDRKDFFSLHGRDAHTVAADLKVRSDGLEHVQPHCDVLVVQIFARWRIAIGSRCRFPLCPHSPLLPHSVTARARASLPPRRARRPTAGPTAARVLPWISRPRDTQSISR